jgi:hypothetical protein
VATALPYSGGVIVMDQNGGARVLTLPTATSTAEATKLIGWYIEVYNGYEGSNNCTVVRGDASNDSLSGAVADAAESAGVTISSNVVTFVSGQSAVGDHVKIVCYSADASNTYFVASAISNA